MELLDTIGELSLIFDVGKREYGGRPARHWLCRCRCGREEILPEQRIKKRKMCVVCYRGPCVVCGKPILVETKKNTCSQTCDQQKKRRKWRDSYYRLVESVHDFNKKRSRLMKSRRQANPELDQKMRERDNQAKRNYRKKHRDRINARYRDYYRRHRNRILALRRPKYAMLTDEERQKRREYDREYKSRWRDNLYKDPVAHREFIKNYRSYVRERKRQAALASLLSITTKLD